MSTTAILGAMAAAVAVLVGVGVYLLFFNESSPYSLPGSVDTNCATYRLDHQHSANAHDAIVKGVVDIGLVESTKVTDAAPLLRTVGTSTYLPSPYRQAAFVCVEEGHEREWADRLKSSFPWVEWAHEEGVNPIDTLGQ